jgi:hypothetical protein
MGTSQHTVLTPLWLLQDKAYVVTAPRIYGSSNRAWLTICGDAEVQMNSKPSHGGGNGMETTTKKQASRVHYLAILVVFAVLILWAFLKLAR